MRHRPSVASRDQIEPLIGQACFSAERLGADVALGSADSPAT
jgi:hypothetical protein